MCLVLPTEVRAKMTTDKRTYWRVSWTENMMDNLRPVPQAMFIFVCAKIAQNDQLFTAVILNYFTKNLVCQILRFNYFNETFSCTVLSNVMVAIPLT